MQNHRNGGVEKPGAENPATVIAELDETVIAELEAELDAIEAALAVSLDGTKAETRAIHADVQRRIDRVRERMGWPAKDWPAAA